MTNEELAAQLVRLRAGDPAALEAIYDALRKPVFTVICRIVRDQATAEDLTQEVFVKLWQSPPDEVRNPRAWVFQVAHNLAVDALRRPDAAELPASLADDSMESRVTAQLDVEAALQTLSARDREIVSLHLTAGLRFREIAQTTNTPLGTVLWRYSRAIDALRAALDGGTA
jgi:RNA polymerase sigma-70 factor (ECF subfamily)